MKVKSLNRSTYIIFIFLFSLQFKANFSYSVSVICKNSPINPLPSGSVPPGGTYTFTPAGLSMNGATGQIFSVPSQPGTYTITNSADPGASFVITIADASPFIVPIGV